MSYEGLRQVVDALLNLLAPLLLLLQLLLSLLQADLYEPGGLCFLTNQRPVTFSELPFSQHFHLIERVEPLNPLITRLELRLSA